MIIIILRRRFLCALLAAPAQSTASLRHTVRKNGRAHFFSEQRVQRLLSSPLLHINPIARVVETQMPRKPVGMIFAILLVFLQHILTCTTVPRPLPNAYYINLKRASNRKRKMEQSRHKYNFNFTRIEAIDGNELVHEVETASVHTYSNDIGDAVKNSNCLPFTACAMSICSKMATKLRSFLKTIYSRYIGIAKRRMC